MNKVYSIIIFRHTSLLLLLVAVELRAVLLYNYNYFIGSPYQRSSGLYPIALISLCVWAVRRFRKPSLAKCTSWSTSGFLVGTKLDGRLSSPNNIQRAPFPSRRVIAES